MSTLSSCPFESVEDSPFLRAQIRSLDEGVDELRERTSKLSKGCSTYRDGLEDAYANDVNFAESVRAFHGPLDDVFGTQVGASEIDRMCSAFRDIADARGALLSTIERDLCNKLENLVSVDLRDANEAKRRFEKCSAEHERARGQFLKLTKSAKPEVLTHAEQELTKTRREHDAARFHLMSRLHSSNSKKQIAFKRQIAETVEAHRVFFQKGINILNAVKPFCDAIISECDTTQEKMNLDSKLLIDAMAAHTAQQEDFDSEEKASQTQHVGNSLTSDRSKAIQTAMHAAEAQTRHARSGSSLGGDELFDLEKAGSQQDNLVGDQNTLPEQLGCMGIQSGGIQQPAPQFLISGYLLKRSSSMRADWKRRFFVLDAFGHLGYYRDADFGCLNGGGGTNGDADHTNTTTLNTHTNTLSRAKDTVSLLTATIKRDLDDAPNLRFCFRVVSPGKTYCLQAESEHDRARWMEAITAAVAGLLSNASAISQSVSAINSPDAKNNKKSNVKGHSRTGSFSAAFFGTQKHKRTASTVSASFHDGFDTSFELVLPNNRNFGGTSSSAADEKNVHVSDDSDPLEVLAAVRSTAGNNLCADCGAHDPEWASLNLGVTLCIECSGAHRQLGVHISKVRSCVLDVKAWEPSVVEIFKKWGNYKANQVWEEKLLQDEKPTPSSSLEVKTTYSIAKWGNKQWQRETNGDENIKHASLLLFKGVTENDVETVMTSIALGAEVNELNTGDPDISNQGISYLRHACEKAHELIVECLLQNGADVNMLSGTDRSTALHGSVFQKQDFIAKTLLKRGASVAITNGAGKTALDVAMDLGSIQDEELFLALQV